MTVSSVDVFALLARSWTGVEVGEPVALEGGFWASMYRVSLAGQPDGVPDEVVVRVAPDRVLGAKETEVQRVVASQGYPTPRVWLSAPHGPSGGWWSIMDFVRGAPLLADLNGASALVRAPQLLRTMPQQLAEVMARLHRLDPGPASAAVEAAAPEAAWSTDDVLARLAAGAVATDRRDLAAAVHRLEATRPATTQQVLCHGDLHPFNVMTDGDGATVIDWTGAVVADPCFDVAFTALLLANPPLQLPTSLNPVVRGIGRTLARRFRAAYRRANPSFRAENLDWFHALHCARVLIDVTAMRAAHGPAAAGHPWALIAPAAARDLSATTDTEVHP